MLSAPLPPDEERRVASLHATGILDSPPEPTFDAIVELARHVTRAPIALVSLVDSHRQWFKAKVGLAIDEGSREEAFCAHAILERAPMIVRDALLDPRFSDHPSVLGAPHIRYYAGVPLLLEDGSAVGTLCVMDHVPRDPAEQEIGALSLLAHQVSNELSLRRRIQAAALHELEAAEPFDDGTPGERAGESVTPPVKAPSLRGGPAPRDTVPIRAPTARAEIARGMLAGRYRIEQSLGGGGMGVVVGAVGPNGERVALKFLRDAATTDAGLVDRFVREAQILLRVSNPHVTRIIDVGNFYSGKPFIVMEWLDGEDLATRLEREGGVLHPRAALSIIRQVCLGAEAVHEAGVVHRDIKPSNVFIARVIDADGETEIVKLLDFGVSALMTPPEVVRSSRLTIARVSIGTPAYMSPEQEVDARLVDASSDVWAIGLVLYQMLTGLLPHRDIDEHIRDQGMTDELVGRRGLPRRLAELICASLRIDRRARIATPRALLEALTEVELR